MMEVYNNRNEVKLPFGMRDGEQVHISGVPSGLACNCFCAYCNAQLSAKKGKKNTHHFAHHNSEVCAHGYETALHIAAKKVLEDSKRILLPDYSIREVVNGEICGQTRSKSGTSIVVEKHFALIENVNLEKYLNDIVPDVIADIDGKPYIIEIAVTSFVDEIKKEKIKDLNIATLEINLSGFDRDSSYDFIRENIVEAIAHKKWIFHHNESNIKANLREKLNIELQADLDSKKR
jgi:hypothetical protein